MSNSAAARVHAESMIAERTKPCMSRPACQTVHRFGGSLHQPFVREFDFVPGRVSCPSASIASGDLDQLETAAVQPRPRPINKNKTTVPSCSSNQWPAKPGKTIVIATTMIRDAQWYAVAMGERSSGGVVTGAARNACVGLSSYR